MGTTQTPLLCARTVPTPASPSPPLTRATDPAPTLGLAPAPPPSRRCNQEGYRPFAGAKQVAFWVLPRGGGGAGANASAGTNASAGANSTEVRRGGGGGALGRGARRRQRGGAAAQGSGAPCPLPAHLPPRPPRPTRLALLRSPPTLPFLPSSPLPAPPQDLYAGRERELLVRWGRGRASGGLTWGGGSAPEHFFPRARVARSKDEPTLSQLAPAATSAGGWTKYVVPMSAFGCYDLGAMTHIEARGRGLGSGVGGAGRVFPLRARLGGTNLDDAPS
jgi:hypothetical protein